MKRSRKTLILLITLAVLVGGYFAVSHFSEKEAVKETSQSVPVSEITADAVEKIAWTQDGETVTLAKKDGNWIYEEDEALPLDETIPEGMADALANLTATRSIEGGTNKADYGLDSPAFTVNVTTADGTQIAYHQGAQNTLTNEYYLETSQADTIYTVADALSDSFDFTKMQLVRMETPGTAENPTELALTDAKSGKTCTLTQDESVRNTLNASYEWAQVEDGVTSPADTDQVSAAIEAAQGIAFTECVDYDATDEELTTYGLDDESALSVRVLDGEQAENPLELLLGASEDTGAYARLPGSRMVYLIDAQSVKTLRDSLESGMLSSDVVKFDADTLKSITAAYDGETHTLTRTAEATAEPEQTSAPEATAEPEATDAPAQATANYAYDGQAVDSETAQALVQDLNALASGGRADAETPGKEILSLTIEREDEAHPVIELTVYACDAQNYLARADGGRLMTVSADSIDRLLREFKNLL